MRPTLVDPPADDPIERLTALGLELPAPSPPGGAYRPTQRIGSLLLVSAQFPFRPDGTAVTGRLGEDLTVEQGFEAARLAAINLLARVHHDLADLGGLRAVRTIGRLEGHLHAAPGFTEHARVMDGASMLLNEVLGDRAGHARALAGSVAMPMNLAIELVATVGLVTA